MFLASFALFTRVFTSFLRFKRGIIFFMGIFLLSLFILLLITRIKKKGQTFFLAKFKEIFLKQISAFLLASIAISLSLVQKDQNLISNFFSFYGRSPHPWTNQTKYLYRPNSEWENILSQNRKTSSGWEKHMLRSIIKSHRYIKTLYRIKLQRRHKYLSSIPV